MRRSSDYISQVSQQYPKDFNSGGAGDWKDIIKQQAIKFEQDEKMKQHVNQIKSQRYFDLSHIFNSQFDLYS